MAEEEYEEEDMYASHPLKLMIRHQQTGLLSHPLCRALVRYKWTKVRPGQTQLNTNHTRTLFSSARPSSTSTSCTTVSLSASSLTSWWPQSDPTTPGSWPARRSGRITTPSIHSVILSFYSGLSLPSTI